MVRLRLGPLGLDYDHDYGIDGRSGWTAWWRGSCLIQFVSLRLAVAALASTCLAAVRRR